ncbi:MAG: hypothetical protein VB912_06605, partial [Pirellulaceae bacterium]
MKAGLPRTVFFLLVASFVMVTAPPSATILVASDPPSTNDTTGRRIRRFKLLRRREAPRLADQNHRTTAHTRRTARDKSMTSFKYPRSRRSDQVDIYHGTRVADPYRWLEDTDSEETQAWITSQNKLTFSYLEQLDRRPVLRKRLSELWNYERFGLPVKRGDH